ncbi:MAG: hypothetical protein Q3991_01555 [Rothia sp. (in: high G+C Gram-positive bacteria)]|uniref:hypothetical protein n=1 Tax=Rothia sp. (in: high G+C Gram-positive bacteria) TaxID=1885016 RepID=UPI0026DD6219|nr:hypothetical protein [Rothia sp. (in: high G+C Gram-positive bacteria)]MDO4883612.1 hypothetical protein [Rothia sp. (in: high G+C Gram-positive bacteria)]
MVENSKISRRKLVVGTAWAAPAVLASTTVPAYAASSAHRICPNNSRITAAEANYHELVVPDGAVSLYFELVGGAGGYLNPLPPKSYATAGHGAQISGDFEVTPGQILKIYLGSSGQAFGTRPAEGGAGYGKGGSSKLSPSSVIPAEEQKILTDLKADSTVIYGGSGGGSSAIVAVDPANPAKETVLVIAGGGGGAGLRGTADDSRNTSDHKRDASWDNYSSPYMGMGGDSTEFYGGDGGSVEEEFYGYHNYYGFYEGKKLLVHGGKRGLGGEGGKGSDPAEIPNLDPLVFKSIEQTPVTIRTMSTTGGVGGDGMRANGADGVAAYGYAYSTHKFYDDDANASEYVHAVSGFAVSPGGGAGYGGGSSGGVLALGMQRYDEHSGEVYAIGMGVTMGGGGSGDSYISPDIDSPLFMTATNLESGYLEYNFCFNA